MNPVSASIKPEEKGKLVVNLHQILQSFLDRKILKIADWDHIASDFKEEQNKKFYGKKTAYLVVQFRMQNNLGDKQDVDEATAQVINSLLDLPESKLVIKGTVFSTERKPVGNILVEAFKKRMRSEVLIGEAYTDTEGKYEIPYTVEKYDADEKGVGLVLAAYDKDGVEISHSKSTTNAEIDIMGSDEFSLESNSLEAKQFAFDFDATLRYTDWNSQYAAIMRAFD